MRVFFINSVCTSGSTGRIHMELARMLNARGDEAKLAFARGGAPADQPYYRIGGPLDVYAHALKARLFDASGTGSRAATKKLVAHMEAYKPDLVQLGNLHGYYLNLPLLFDYLKKSNIPVVWTLHDCWAFTGHCAHFTDVNCARWKQGCFACPKRGAYPQSLFFDRSKAVYQWKKAMFTSLNNLTLVAPSRWLDACLKESFLKDVPRCVIENGVNLDIFRPKASGFKERCGLAGKKIALGVATPWDRRKGLDDMIALSRRLPPEWTVVLVALTERQIKKLPPNMLGLPRTESAEALSDIYNAADVYVNPTYCDTFPTTNIEALACGAPVVTYAAGGSPEALTEKCGEAVPMGDIAALTAAVLGAPEKYSRQACAARGTAFSRGERFLPYLKLYDARVGGGE